MPELPEVENVRAGLEHLIIGEKIFDIDIYWDRLINHMSSDRFCQMLRDKSFQKIGRRGKYLVFDLGELLMISHLRMEGKYLLSTPEKKREKHTHVIFQLASGQQLRYHDVRKFGRFELIPNNPQSLDHFFSHLGPEPNSAAFDLAWVTEKLARHHKAIKKLLLDQTLVAGIGNIYADEILFDAKIHPEESASSLTEKQAKQIIKSTNQIMAAAILAGGTTIRTYYNAFGRDGSYQEQLKVYGRTGEACERCGTMIEKKMVGGRGTHFCPNCQQNSHKKKVVTK